MNVNEKVTKVLALLALIDDTTEHITRIKTNYDEQIRLIRGEAAQQTDVLQANLNEQYTILAGLTGIDTRDDDFDFAPRSDSRRGTTRTSTPARKQGNSIKEQALLYIGRELAYPTPETTEGTENGQALPSID